MTMIATNSFLLGVSRKEEESFRPQQILQAFDLQLARRKRLEKDDVMFLPPPKVEAAEAIVEESKAALTAILNAHNLSADAVVEDNAAKAALVELVRGHLKKFAY